MNIPTTVRTLPVADACLHWKGAGEREKGKEEVRERGKEGEGKEREGGRQKERWGERQRGDGERGRKIIFIYLLKASTASGHLRAFH